MSFRRITIDDMQALARERGGKCLSESYVNVMKPLRWECAKGHRWATSYRNIQHNDSWCPKCAALPNFTMEDLREVAAQRGGECLSKTYVSSRVKLR